MMFGNLGSQPPHSNPQSALECAENITFYLDRAEAWLRVAYWGIVIVIVALTATILVLV